MTRTSQTVLAASLALCSGIALTAPPTHPAAATGAPSPAHATTPAAATASAATPAAASSSADAPSLAEIQAFTRAFAIIKQAYVDPVSDQRLMHAAIRGMLSGLDPHSAFLDHRELANFDEDTSGMYAGLGIEVAEVNHRLVIIAPLDGGPAKRAGILSGDSIVAIDGVVVQPDAIDAASKKLRGPIGTKITLTIVHASGGKPVQVPLVRDRIRVSSVSARMLQPGFAYLRISEFQEDTSAELDRKLADLQRKDGPLRGAVLDLRSNPGGLVTSAVNVADAFLDSGTIVSTRGRLSQSDMKFTATPGDLLQGAPLVVLVDNGTASAAEIVTGALQDNHRALVLGRRTFGKGSVQTVLPLGNGDALKLTTARYYTPDGTSIQVAGITPDILLGDVTVQADRSPSLDDDEHEGDLPNHLAGGNAKSHADAGALAISDYALSEALHVLQGLALARQPTAIKASSAH